MARKFKARIIVEERRPDGLYEEFASGFSNIPDAEEYVRDVIEPGQVLRVARISGEFRIKQEIQKA